MRRPARTLAPGFAGDQFLKPAPFDTSSGMISAYPKDMDGVFRREAIGTDPEVKRSDPVLGERRLWAAVLEQAILDLNPTTEGGSSWVRSGSVRENKQAHIRREALKWFETRSLDLICNVLNLEPGPIRKRVPFITTRTRIT